MKEPPRPYASAAAFRGALETRLKAISKAEGIDLQRLRRQVSFDRLLARLFAEKNAPWLLKGGYAMELRLRTARTTKDIDISLPAQVIDVFVLQRAISATFSIRGTHPIPANLPAPPAFWTVPFLVLARECHIELTLSDALQILTEYVSL
jgi:Nucleotidyl transferase AbiEii toxin, Type IV TA system